MTNRKKKPVDPRLQLLQTFLKTQGYTAGIGIPWYRSPEQYRLLNTMFEPGSVLEDTYDEWLANAEAGIEGLKRDGLRPVKVYLDPQPFEAWCRKNGMKLDQLGRCTYAASVAAMTEGVPSFQPRAEWN